MQQPHLTVEQRQLALRLKARGWTLREIGPQVGCAFQTVALIARRGSRRPVRLDGWVPGPGRLTLADREEITLGLHGGESFTVIAARLSRAVSTVSREVAANGGRGAYRACHAMGMSQSWLNIVYTAGGMIAAINSIVAGIGIALILRVAGLVIVIAASCGAITALVIYELQLRWALSCYVAGLAALTKNTAA
jgi:hypothetical protein